MGIFSFLKKEKPKLKCDWCKEEMEKPACYKSVGNVNYYFCSQSCKKNFRNSGKNRVTSCPTCALR